MKTFFLILWNKLRAWWQAKGRARALNALKSNALRLVASGEAHWNKAVQLVEQYDAPQYAGMKDTAKLDQAASDLSLWGQTQRMEGYQVLPLVARRLIQAAHVYLRLKQLTEPAPF